MKVNGDLDLIGDINIGGQAKSLKVERVSSLPSVTSPDESRLVYNQTNKKIYYNNGTAYTDISQAAYINYLHVNSFNPGVGGVLIDTVYDPLVSTRVTGIVSDSLNQTISFSVSSKTLNATPVITCNGVTANLTIDTFDNTDGYVWNGTVTLTLLSTDTLIEFVHSEGGIYSYDFTYLAKPTVTACSIGGYPVGQSEVKENDTVQLTITSNKNISSVIGFSGQGNKSFTQNILSPSTTVTISVPIDNKGNTPTAYPLRFKIDATDGSRSLYILTSDYGSVDGTDTLILNNTYPSITIGGITYPGSQTAISTAQSATVDNTITDSSSVVYSSPNSQLTVTNPTTYETSKTVTYASGDYNLAINNLRITATRSENNATTISNAVVHINNELPTCTLSLDVTRLRSGGAYDSSPQEYVMTITTSHTDVENITSDISSGTFTSGSWTKISSDTWTRTVSIDDTDAKGIHNLVDFIATTSGGLEQSTLVDNSFEIGGFVLRILTIDALANEADIGTDVTDVTKLRATNLFTGAPGEHNLSYAPNLTNVTGTFTITTPANTLNSGGHLWHNNDVDSVNNNYSGTLQIEIEEIEQ